jgi:hypothetical protein
MLLDDPGRVRSQITSVVCQNQWFDFDCNLVLTRKLIIRIPAGLGLNPLYTFTPAFILKTNGSNFTRGFDSLHGDACSPKSFEV